MRVMTQDILDVVDMVRCLRWVKQHPLADKDDVQHVWRACSLICKERGVDRKRLRHLEIVTGGVHIDAAPELWPAVEPPALMAKEVLAS